MGRNTTGSQVNDESLSTVALDLTLQWDLWTFPHSMPTCLCDSPRQEDS